MGSGLLKLPFFKNFSQRSTTEKGWVLPKRVVVTGVGVVSPIGIGKEAFWQALISGRCGIGMVTHFDASSYPCKFAGEVNNFIATDYIDPKSARRLSRGTQFAIVSTQKAIEDANLDLGKEDPYRVGLSYGTALGPMDIYEKFGSTFYERGLRRVHPSFVGLMNHNAMIGALAETFRIHGYNMAVSTGCSSGSMAIANAYHVVSSGMAEILVAGGTDTPIYPLTFALYSASNSMTSLDGDPKSAMCPYDRRRTGYILGEGAGTLIIEELEHAQKRKARIYAEILGFGLTNDASDSIFFSPEAGNIIKAFQIALAHTSLRPEDVGYICGHAYSGVILDKKESQAIKKVFGDHAYKLAVSSIKAATGDAMAGATAMQSIAACLALREGVLPPTINYEVPDPELDLDYVPKEARKKDIQIAMSNCFGLGGTNVVVVYRRV
jgi:3-oxoacyl-[acyl-carrier-protein] synthase II